MRDRLVQREARRDLPGCRAGAVELGYDAGDGLAGSDVPARGVAAGVPGDLLARLAAQVVLEPVALHGRGVADQPEHGGQRGHQAPTGVVLGQAAQLSAEHYAVILEEPFLGFPFSGDGDKVFFICQGWGICHRKRLRARLDRADMRDITRPAMRGVPDLHSHRARGRFHRPVIRDRVHSTTPRLVRNSTQQDMRTRSSAGRPPSRPPIMSQVRSDGGRPACANKYGSRPPSAAAR